MDLGTQARLDELSSAALPQKFTLYFSKVSLLCVSHPAGSRYNGLSHLHILEFGELFLTTLIQSLRPEMEFRMLEELLIAEMKIEK